MPTRPRDDHPIQIDEDLAFQIRVDQFQRIGRWLLFVLVLCALAGLVGAGL